MEKIKIFDTTLRDGEQSPGCSMNVPEKLAIAKKLDEMKVDIIEAGFAASSKRDFEAIQEISKVTSYSTIASLARCNKNDIDLAYQAVNKAQKSRLHVFIATSDIHMKYKLKKKPEEVKQITKEMVEYAKQKCDDIEFSLEDATRTDLDFACEIIDIAVESGATTINIPDTVGYTIPEKFSEFLNYIKKHSRYINQVDLSVHCHNDLGLATANSLKAIEIGANQVECTINGIGERAGNASLEQIVAVLKMRKDYYQKITGIDTTKIYDVSRLVQETTGSYVQRNFPIVGQNAFLHESGIHQAGQLENKDTYEILTPEDYGVQTEHIVLGIHSGKNAFVYKIEQLGHNCCDYNISKVVEEMKEYFSSDSFISDEVFESIIDQSRIKNKDVPKQMSKKRE